MMFVVRVQGKTYTLRDMRDWFIQTRGFPSILYFGRGRSQISGEGQAGGRYVSGYAHAAENAFVSKYGIEGYRKRMDKLMGRR